MAQRTVNIGIGNQVAQNDFDAMPIYKEVKEVTDDYGNRFIRIPKFYIHKENTAGKLAIRISKEPIAGGYLPHCFYDHVANKELPYIDVGKYLASLSSDGTKLESKTGVAPLVARNIVDFRELAEANGDGYQQMDIHVIDVLQTLFYVEFATLHSQSIHSGYTGGTEAKPTGGTDSVVASSGAMGADNTHQFKYRGIEDLWGNLYQFVDGVNINDHQAWVTKDFRDYASNVFASPYEKLGYVNLDTNSWVTEMGYDPKHPYAQLPTKGGGGTTTYYADHYYQDSGQRIARFGGRWSNGSSAGLSLWYLYHASSAVGSSVGGRLLRKPL